MALAAVACGADGLIIEVHNNPAEALSDKDQALTFQQFEKLMKRISSLHQFVAGLN
jgi:3-deoxy-7-phosphoheptulonate synthase